jgi:DNA primase large subunit
MSEEAVTIKTYYYLPWRGAWVLVLIAGAVAMGVAGKYVPAAFAVFFAALAGTAHFGIRVDLKNKTYVDFLSMLGFVNGKKEKFESIEYVFIKSSKKSQTMNSTSTSKMFTDDFYDGYIKFDQDEKVFLITHKKKERVMKTLKEISEKLGLEIVDHTEK